MFLEFLMLLRSQGLKVSMHEWLALMEGMEMGLHGQTLSGFYVLCRTLTVKTESDLYKFDKAFGSFFKNISSEQADNEIRQLLNNPDAAAKAFSAYMEHRQMDMAALKPNIEKRLEAWDESPQGTAADSDNASSESAGAGSSSGAGSPGAGGQMEGGGGRSIIHQQGDRRFRDWRTDCTIESRQFQMAFRLLRELSRKLNTSEEELDINGTIHSTCSRGGILDIRMQPPRRNKLKVMVLIDSGGSMRPFEQLCSLLFQSLNKANTFTDLKIYYFHNCLEGRVYLDPSIDTDKTLDTEWILKNISSEYRVIFVGDADMAMHELVGSGSYAGSSLDGLTWFKMFREKYPHSIWLHPQEREENIMWMGDSFIEIEKVFPMFQLSIDGLKDGMYRLMKAN